MMKTKMKRFFCILLVALLCVSLVACGESHEGQAKTPSGSSIQKGRNYKDVIRTFEEHGFTNIKTVKIEDLILGWLTEDGEVESVSVDGDEDYSPDKWYPKDVEVVISYHTFAEEETYADIAEDPTETITEKPTVAPTNAPTETPTEKPTEQEKPPIDIIENYSLLQSLFLNIEPDMTPDELKTLGKECGFFTSNKDSTEYRTYLYIAIDDTPRPDGGYHLDYGVNYIYAYYERNTKDSEPIMKKVSYHFSPSYYNVEYDIDGGNINGDHYFVKKGLYSVDPTVTYPSLQSALDAAISMVGEE